MTQERKDVEADGERERQTEIDRKTDTDSDLRNLPWDSSNWASI